MEVTKASESHEHNFNRKWKLLKQLAKRVGIQGTKKDENMIKIMEKSVKKIDLLREQNYNLEKQVENLINQTRLNSNSNAQVLALQRKILAMESSTQSRESLIESLKGQIKDLKMNEITMKQAIMDLQIQIWPLPFFDGNEWQMISIVVKLKNNLWNNFQFIWEWETCLVRDSVQIKWAV